MTDKITTQLTTDEVIQIARSHASEAFDQRFSTEYTNDHSRFLGWSAYCSYEQNLADTLADYSVPYDLAAEATDLFAREYHLLAIGF